MKELTNKLKPIIFVMIIPYLLILVFLFYPINQYINSPGGLTEVEHLIEIEYNQDKEITGTISTTYIMSIKRPSPSLILIASFSPYNDLYILTGSNLNYTNQEIAKISYLDKETSVNAAIIVAYEKAALINPEISIQYDLKTLVYGKAEYLDFYDEIDFGDEFVKLIGDNQTEVTSLADIASYTVDSDAYEWFFLDESGTEYSLILTKDEVENKFGVTLKQYYLVDQENTYPKYKEASSNIGGPSGGLLQTLSIYNMLISDDLTNGRKIAGTGTINYDGSVGYIGGVEQKVLTAYLNGVDLFFMPSLDEDYYYDNYQEALRACETHNINPDGWLIPVSTFQEAIDYLEGE